MTLCGTKILSIVLLFSVAASAYSAAPCDKHRLVTSGAEGAKSSTRFLPPKVSALREDLVPRIQAWLLDRGIASVTIVVFNQKEELWAESFGYANVAAKVKADLGTVYNTGSTFKILVVTAVMQLVETGVLDLDTPVNQYLSKTLDDFSAEGAPLTLRHMLAHRAGLPPSRPVPDWDIWSRLSPPPMSAQVADIVAIRRPGEVYDYCNVCFPIYAEIIESVSGMPLDDYLRHEILIPTGSRYTEPLYPDAQMVEHLALPYQQIGARSVPLSQKFLQSWVSGDAYLRPLDMTNFLRIFLNNGRADSYAILDPSTVAAMMEPQFGGEVSLGFIVTSEGSRTVLSWDGGVYGGSAVYQLEPTTQLGVYIASNSHQTTDELHRLARRARDLVLGVAAPSEFTFGSRESVNVLLLDRSELQQYVGLYRSEAAGISIRVDILNDHLALISPEGKRFDVLLIDVDTGVLIGADEHIEFGFAKMGGVASLRIVSKESSEFVRVTP